MGVREYKKKGVYLIPNFFTTGNLFSGFYAIIAVFNGDFHSASIAILVATVFDALDGMAARFTKATSRFGVEYDSLADLVSFGVAPGLLIYSWALSSYGRIGWVAAFLFVVCGALRLARFNVQVSTLESKKFLGLPIPSAACMIATLVILDHYILSMGKEIRPLVILVMTYGLAFLMVSSIPYRSLKGFNLRDRKPFHVLVAMVLLLIIVVAEPQVLLFFLFGLYTLSGIIEKPLIALYQRVHRRGKRKPKEQEGKNQKTAFEDL
ncbi:MAG TPA: CDP-diacylglycerol--serine O-phosphatidyltransferase [Nitrospiria bacterium]|jgi:CDP-diacylglycerol--serine O-phosphatidyltransferase